MKGCPSTSPSARLGSDRFAFVVVHVRLGAVRSRSVPLAIYTHLFDDAHAELER
jgi:hypothetical protein